MIAGAEEAMEPDAPAAAAGAKREWRAFTQGEATMKRNWIERIAAGASAAAAACLLTGIASADSMDDLVAAAKEEGQLTTIAAAA